MPDVQQGPSDSVRLRRLSPWREQALTRISQLETKAAVAAKRSDGMGSVALDAAREHLRTARDSAMDYKSGSPLQRYRAGVTGADMERVSSNIDAAEIELLRVASNDELVASMPDLLALVHGRLEPDDPRTLQIDELAARASAYPFAPGDRERLAASVRAARLEERREVSRIRSFRGVILVTTLLLTLIAVGLASLATTSPSKFPLCFATLEGIACPTSSAPVTRAASAEVTVSPVARTSDLDRLESLAASGWDVPLVELLGLMAAAVVSVATLRGMSGTSVPYGLPTALVLLKLPTGALTAVLGLQLMRGGFIPGFGNLDSSGQILAYAVVFGAAQQLFTRLVDLQMYSVLADIGQRPFRLGRGQPVSAPPSSVITTQVDAAVKGAVPAALREALAGPVLANFSGWLGVRVTDPDAAEIRISGDNDIVLEPGADYACHVRIGTEAERANDAPLRISDGVDADAVSFTVSIESSAAGLSRAEQTLTVGTRESANELAFPLRIEPEVSRSWLWIRVLQRGRLVLELELGVVPAASEAER